MAKILVLGATGYVGGRLVPRLLQEGHPVRCLVRNARKISGRKWAKAVEVFEGDVLKAATLPLAFQDIDFIYYLVHSMAAGEKEFQEMDRKAAVHVASAAEQSGVKRIIYLGGLGRRDVSQSAHLRSRHEVGDIFRSGAVPATEFRAAVVVGSGSLSFEMIHHLVNRLPIMICPRWVYTRTQPIAVDDVLAYLILCLEKPESIGRIFDIGGTDVMTYRDMMLTTARVLGLKRLLIQVPVLTPRLSSYWVNLVTPIPARLARALIESLRYETICEDRSAHDVFDIRPLSFEEAVRRALVKVQSAGIETIWTDASTYIEQPAVDPSHLQVDRRIAEADVPAQKLFYAISILGGDNGWYYADWLWKLRGFIDQQFGGAGLRRGRRHPVEITVGDALDFWRVEEFIANRRLLLRAEMKVWGQAWLEFNVESINPDRARLIQTARYYPRGVFGLLYWFIVYPIHALVFQGLAKAICRRAEGINRGEDNSPSEGKD